MESDPCKDCGLCCQHLLVEANALDVLREPRIEEVRPLGKRAVNLPILEACWVLAALTPCPFLDTAKRCGIYSSRPQVCVSFIAGAPKCNELRLQHGLGVLPAGGATRGMVGEIMKAAIQAERQELE